MLRRLLTAPAEARALTYQALWTAGDLPYATTLAGTTVTQESSTRINAVYAAIRLYADTVSALPVDTFYRSDGERLPYRPKPAWVDSPDPDGLTRQQFYAQWMMSKLVAHAACVRILRDPATGDTVALKVLDPRGVERLRDGNGRIFYRVDGQYRVEADDMIYDSEMLKPGALMGTSRIDELRETLGISKALDDFAARYFGSGTLSSGIIAYPGDMTEEQATRLKDQFEKNSRGLRNAHRPNVLTGGAKYERISDDPEKAQVVQSREFSLEEVARAFRVPPNMLQSQKPGSVAYASREQDAIQFVTYSILPYVAAMEQHLSRLLPGGAFIRFNVDGLLRASLVERYGAYSQGIQAGFLTVADIRRLEDLRPVTGGEVLRVPLENINIAAADLVETEKKSTMAARLINVGFDPEAVLSALGLPPIPHSGIPSVQLQQVPEGTAI